MNPQETRSPSSARSADARQFPGATLAPQAAQGADALPIWLHSSAALVGTLLLMLLALAVGAGFLAVERHALHEAAADQSELFARVLEDQANRTFTTIDLSLASTADNLVAHPEALDSAALGTVLQRTLQGQPYLRSLSLVDAAGRVLASSNAENVDRVIARSRLLPGNQRAGLGALLPARDLSDLADPAGGSAAAPAALSRAAMLPLVRPLHGAAAGTPVPPALAGAWLVAVVHADYFANQYQLMVGDMPLRAALLGYDRRLIAASEDVHLAPGEPVRANVIFERFLPEHEKGRFEGAGVDGAPVLATFRSARRHALVLLAEVPQAAVDAQMARALRTTGLATLGVLLLIAVLGLLAWRSLRGHAQVRARLARAHDRMAAQHAFTERLFELCPVPMVVKDGEGRFVQVNKAFTELTGLPPERVIGRTMRRLYPAHLAAPVDAQERLALAQRQPASFEQPLLDADGLPRDVLMRVTPYTGEDGRVAGLIGCFTDVSEFREAEVRTQQARLAAERANSAKSEFLANISHELRTPLQSIMGYSELGLARTAGDRRLQTMFTDIHAAGTRMLALVNNLLDLSRLESTVGHIRLQPVDLAPGLLAVRDELQPLAARRGIHLVPPADPQPLWTLADPVRLQQVLRNLLANALRFAPDASDVRIDWRTTAEGRHLISVRDCGPGIPDDELDSIFGAFVQSSRTKDGAGGTGLGLAICRKIVQAHRGRIRASNAPGGGALFEIRLPAIDIPRGSLATGSDDAVDEAADETTGTAGMARPAAQQPAPQPAPQPAQPTAHAAPVAAAAPAADAPDLPWPRTDSADDAAWRRPSTTP
ncbi:cache domain-containing sensor histidine kinase [Aquabacterium sp. OR-4]|uniref:cache domain-containing sensor histidine kinase n=1 Tax=Aquabacterium sp. OR-4 TaxID=2978127 RepID=UPI0021B3580A|nr:ATP-binding protein [Aquabacterium sp. OR-4]MDT7835784.1 ATP-binding protein [Aquabacterium sp. OR-4]